MNHPVRCCQLAAGMRIGHVVGLPIKKKRDEAPRLSRSGTLRTQGVSYATAEAAPPTNRNLLVVANRDHNTPQK